VRFIFVLASFLLIATPVFADTTTVCFSPDGHCDKTLVSFIKSASSSLDIAIYSLTLPSIVDAIVAAQKNGIKVRVLVDYSQNQGQSSLVSMLEDAGIPVRYGSQKGIMHNKFTIVDNSKLETGSFNYSRNAATENAENQIYLTTPNVVNAYVCEFNKIWATGTN
jgi:phosphatidylserine/phosphatidylglycerophosphate/cardiolipin synthase-like enzyme